MSETLHRHANRGRIFQAHRAVAGGSLRDSSIGFKSIEVAMENPRAAAILPEEPRVAPFLPQPRLGSPKSGVRAAIGADAPASLKRAADVATPAASAQREAADVHVIAPDIAPRGAFVSDAALEPLHAAARDRRASYFDAGLPIVSVVVLGVLVCLAWLL